MDENKNNSNKDDNNNNNNTDNNNSIKEQDASVAAHSLIDSDSPQLRFEVPDQAINILTYWFGLEYWRRFLNPASETYEEERQHANNNLSAYWDDMWTE